VHLWETSGNPARWTDGGEVVILEEEQKQAN